MSAGWRENFADVVAAIRGTLADAVNAGSMSAANFLKLAGLPASAVPTARTIGTTPPLTGGGDLSANRTLAISAATSGAAGSLSAVDFSKLASVPDGSLLTLSVIGPEMDLAGGAGTIYTLIPPCPFKLVRITTQTGWLTQVGGTRSAVGQTSAGSDAGATNWATAGNEAAGVLTQAADTLVSISGTQVAPVPVLDLTTNGFLFKVVSNVTGTAPVCKARFVGQVQLLHT